MWANSNTEITINGRNFRLLPEKRNDDPIASTDEGGTAVVTAAATAAAATVPVSDAAAVAATATAPASSSSSSAAAATTASAAAVLVAVNNDHGDPPPPPAAADTTTTTTTTNDNDDHNESATPRDNATVVKSGGGDRLTTGWHQRLLGSTMTKRFLPLVWSRLIQLPTLCYTLLASIPIRQVSSLPILKILQVIWLVLMIGQSLPGAETSFWPFNKYHNASNTTGSSSSSSNNHKSSSPFYVEMRSDLYGHEKQFTNRPVADGTDGGGGGWADRGLLMTLLWGVIGGGTANEADRRHGSTTDYPINTGIPNVQYITLTHLNRAYEGYTYSIQAAVTTRVQAGRVYGQTTFRRVVEKVLDRFSHSRSDRDAITQLEEQFLIRATTMMDQLRFLRASSLSTLLVNTTTTMTTTTVNHYSNATLLRQKLPQCNSTRYQIVPAVAQTSPPFLQSYQRRALPQQQPPVSNQDVCANNSTRITDNNSSQTDYVLSNTTNATNTTAHHTVLALAVMNQTATTNNSTSSSSSSSSNDTMTNGTTTTPSPTVPEQIKQVNSELEALVTTFLHQIDESVTPGPAGMLKDALSGHLAIWGTEALVTDLQQMPLRTMFRDAQHRRRLYVTYFNGDIMATTVAVLREEVTAMVRSATPGVDEVLVVLQSGGGTVTGYGLVAAQLLLLKQAGLTLTVAVEQVAASGGYMAACVGDTIVCSPFAVVGSIGVIQEMPNIYERLKREGVEFHQVTAGQYKRVLSPTKEVTQEDLQKTKDDIEEVWTLFKDFVSEQRPTLNMDTVATGEVWYGKRAVELGLCDALQAADDVLIEFIDRGYDVYRVKYEEPVPDFWEQLTGKAKIATNLDSGAGSLLRWSLQKMMALLQAELGKMAGIGNDNHQHRLLLV